jgi:integrator complex subunit 3
LRLNIERNELQPAHLPPHSVSRSSLQNVSHLAITTPAPEQQSAKIVEVRLSKEPAGSSIPISGDLFTTSCPSNVTIESQFDAIESLAQNLAEAMKKSNRMGLQILEEILLSYVNLDGQASTCGSTFPETLSSRIADQFESVGNRLFSPFDVSISVPSSDSGIHSPTILIARSFILSQHERLQEMLLFWSRNGFHVGAHLLSYATRLAYEACISDSSGNAIINNNFSKISDSGMSLLLFHVDGYFSILNGRKQDFLEGSVSTSKMDKELVNMLVKNAFAAYKCFLERSRTILHKEDDLALSKLFILDITSCFLCERKKTKFFYSIFCHLADLCAGNIDIISFLVSQLDHADLLEMQFEIGLKRFFVFGESTEDIFHLMKNSLSWDPSEQHKLWGLIRSELAVSKVQLEKIILKFFCSNELDANTSAVAVGGLLTLCICRAPTPELVGAIMLLPDDVFQDFAATVLASWVVSNASKLFDSLTKFSEKFDNENGNVAGSVGIVINHSAILWLLNYFKSQGMNGSNILSTFSASISCEKPA